MEPEKVENGEQDSLNTGSLVEPNYADIVAEDFDDYTETPVEETTTAPEETPPQQEVVTETPATVETTEVEEAADEEEVAVPPRYQGPTEEQKAEYLRQLDDVQKVLEGKYKFAPEDAAVIDEIGAKPSEYLPKILAKLHQETYFNAVEAVMKALPQTVPEIAGQMQAAQIAEEQFFQAWPTLAEHQDIAMRAIQVSKQMNPNASLKTLIQKSGQLAMIELGQTVPAQTTTRTERTATPAPFSPAAPGGSAAPLGANTASKSYEQKIFEEMIEDELRS